MKIYNLLRAFKFILQASLMNLFNNLSLNACTRFSQGHDAAFNKIFIYMIVHVYSSVTADSYLTAVSTSHHMSADWVNMHSAWKKKVKKIKNTLYIYKMTVQQERETLHHRVTRQTLFCNLQGKSPWNTCTCRSVEEYLVIPLALYVFWSTRNKIAKTAPLITCTVSAWGKLNAPYHDHWIILKKILLTIEYQPAKFLFVKWCLSCQA